MNGMQLTLKGGLTLSVGPPDDFAFGVRASELKRSLNPPKVLPLTPLIVARVTARPLLLCEYHLQVFFLAMMWPRSLKFIVDDTS
jgi:hypothetical protein